MDEQRALTDDERKRLAKGLETLVWLLLGFCLSEPKPEPFFDEWASSLIVTSNAGRWSDNPWLACVDYADRYWKALRIIAQGDSFPLGKRIRALLLLAGTSFLEIENDLVLPPKDVADALLRAEKDLQSAENDMVIEQIIPFDYCTRTHGSMSV